MPQRLLDISTAINDFLYKLSLVPFLSLSPFLPRSFPSFLPPYPTHHSLLPFLVQQTHQWHFTRSVYISLVCFWCFFCLDNCPYFSFFFRGIMRNMVEQMRTGREWRAACQDGSNTIVFFVACLQRGLFNFKTGINEKLLVVMGVTGVNVFPNSIRTLAYTPFWWLVSEQSYCRTRFEIILVRMVHFASLGQWEEKRKGP